MTNPLSPAAAVLIAYWKGQEASQQLGVAAALKAAADQVVPEEPLHGGDQRWMYERDTRQESRKKFLAIAAELEGHQ